MKWESFRRFGKHDSSDTANDFFGCVDAAGEWFDSAFSFETAVHWCCKAEGEHNLSPEQEIAWMSDEGRKRGLSVIHGSQIKRMYEAGLIN